MTSDYQQRYLKGLQETERYRKDKQHLRPCPSWERKHTKPQWWWNTMRRTKHSGAGKYIERYDDGHHGGYIVMRCSTTLMDHMMISLEKHLVFEPYSTVDRAEIEAKKFAETFDLNYSVSPIAWHWKGCVRVEFWPK